MEEQEADFVIIGGFIDAKPKYPAAIVYVDLSSGPGGNSFAVLASAKDALKDAGASREEIGTFFKEATSGDYAQLLHTILAWMTVANKQEVISKISYIDGNPQESEDDEEVLEVPDVEDWEADQATKDEEETDDEAEMFESAWDDNDNLEDDDEGDPF